MMSTRRAAGGNPGAVAGERGRSAAPLTYEQRCDHYSGETYGWRATPAQRRRLWHKARRSGELV